MLNPDGVILGNYRTGLAGKSNREFWLSSLEFTFPLYRLARFGVQCTLNHQITLNHTTDGEPAGSDLNRKWKDPDQDMHPTVCARLPNLQGT